MTLTEARRQCATTTVSASYYSKMTGQQTTVRVRGITLHMDGTFTIRTNDGSTERLTGDRVSFNR